uniref:Inositol-1-monophosphatase n=1 Tax=Aerophobetes bacterium TaxID=2030807 RepID=A0A2A4YDC8_UNCAE
MQQDIDIPNVILSKLTSIAILAAQTAGEVLKRGFDTTLITSSKEGKHNLCTDYDEKVEKMIIAFIKDHFPDHTFLGEEFGAQGNNPQAIQWILDPIDGTVNFAHSIPVFSISIAATFNGKTLSGVVYSPMSNELFVAEKGSGAYLNGTKLKISKTTTLSDSFLATGFPYNTHENPGGCINHFMAFAKLGIPIRRLGSAALDLAYVAAGRYDGFWEVSLKPWDFAVGCLLIEEAGGKISDYDNSPITTKSETSIVASNGHIQEQIVNFLKHNTCDAHDH